MHTVTKTFTIDLAHRLPNHLGLCKNVHGHTYKIELTIGGPLQQTWPSEGMVVDFGNMKEIIERIKGEWDHAYIGEETDEVRNYLQHEGFKTYSMPYPPTAENMCRELLGAYPELREVTIRETPTSKAVLHR